MKRFAFAALPLAMMAVACDGPAEDLGEEKDDVMEAQAEVIDETSDVLEAQADLADTPSDAAALEAQAETLEDTADGM